MFKDSYVTQLTPWTVLEESTGMPQVSYPAFVGSGKLGIGLDCAGLQSLPDTLGPYLGCKAAPYHTLQAELYLLHEGMISEHLYRDEAGFTGKEIPLGPECYGMHRNFLPLGYLTQSFTFAGKTIYGAAVVGQAFEWRRAWDLQQAILRTGFSLERRVDVETEIFTPYGGETVYVKLTRRAVPGAEGTFRWEVRLPLATRHGLPLYDQPDAVQPGRRTLLARIDRASEFRPSEDYAVVYGVAADGERSKPRHRAGRWCRRRRWPKRPSPICAWISSALPGRRPRRRRLAAMSWRQRRRSPPATTGRHAPGIAATTHNSGTIRRISR